MKETRNAGLILMIPILSVLTRKLTKSLISLLDNDGRRKWNLPLPHQILPLSGVLLGIFLENAVTNLLTNLSPSTLLPALKPSPNARQSQEGLTNFTQLQPHISTTPKPAKFTAKSTRNPLTPTFLPFPSMTLLKLLNLVKIPLL